MKEFQVNKYLTLRLENEDTIIYVAGQRFRQCKYLLLNIQIDDIQLLDEIESIEEAAERLDKSQEGEGLKEIEIPLRPSSGGTAPICKCGMRMVTILGYCIVILPFHFLKN